MIQNLIFPIFITEISETNPKTHHSPRQLLPQLLKAFASQSSQLSSMPSQTKRHPSPTGASQPAEPSPSPESYQRKAPKAPSKHSYACSFCLRTFACDSHWRRHEQTHTKAKPFHCTVCLKGFSDKSYIRVHMEKYCKKMRQSRENGKGVENGMIFQRKSKKSKRHLGSVEVGLDLRLPPNRCSQSFPSVDLQSTNDRPSVIQLAAGPSSTQTSAENSSFSL